MKYDSTGLIDAIKRNASIPTSQTRFSNTDFLKYLNEELQLTIVGELLSLRQDYFITTIDTALVASQSTYTIPTAAIGWKLESIGYVDSDGNYSRIPQVTRDQRQNFEFISDSTQPSAVYISGNNVVTVPDMGSNATGSLRFDLVRIQNELVLTTACGKVTSVTDTGTDYQITVDTMPVSDGDTVDIVSGTNPFNIIARGVTASVSGFVATITYGDDFSRAPVANDYLCEAGKTPYPNIPEDYHPVLAQAATIRCLVASNDAKGLQTQSIVLNNMFERMRKRSQKRVNDAPKKIVGNNYLLNLGRGRGLGSY